MNLFIDSPSLEVNWSLDNEEIDYNNKHPLLLQAHDYVVCLMLFHEHQIFDQAGAQTILSNVCFKFCFYRQKKSLSLLTRFIDLLNSLYSDCIEQNQKLNVPSNTILKDLKYFRCVWHLFPSTE